jgi:hypothetical protein
MEKIIGPLGVRCAYPTHPASSPLTIGQALARDGFRCMVTGMFDGTSMKTNHELRKMCSDLNAFSTTVQASHILNESTMQDIDPAGGSEKTTVINKVCAVAVPRILRCPLPSSIIQTGYAVTVMAVLRDFGLGALGDEFLKANGVHNRVHNLGNLLSLGVEVHIYFDKLELWFEGTNQVRCS